MTEHRELESGTGEEPRGAESDPAERAPAASEDQPATHKRRRRRRPGARLARALHIPQRVFFMTSRVIGVLIGVSFLAGAGLVVFLSQTVVGRNAVSGLLENVLNGAIDGQVRFGPIIGGDLISGATVAHFEIATEDGDVFVSLDSVRVRYNPLSFLRANYRIRNARVGRAEINLIQYPDGAWIMDRLFGGGDTTSTSGPRILIADLELEQAHLTVRTPWAADASGRQRDSLVAAGLRGDALWRVIRTDSGTVERVIELQDLRGRMPLLRLADPRRPMKFEMESISAVARVVQEPLDIQRFDGSATFRDSVLIDIERLQLPASALSGSGFVIPSDPPTYRFELDADPMSFTDLTWLPVPIPSTGGGPVDLVLRAGSDEIPIIELSNGEVTVDDSRIRGGFVLALEPTPRFASIDLVFSPLRLRMVDEVLDRPGLIDGYLTGSLSGSGPIDRLVIDAPIQARRLSDTLAPSRVLVQGAVSMVEPFPFDSLRLAFDRFEPRWSRVVGISTELTGRVTGTSTLSGRSGGPLAFEMDLHVLAGGDSSHVTGDGRVDLVEASELDVRFNADPLALSMIQPYVRDVKLVGSIRGPIAASGALSDLHARARLETPRGELEFDGLFDLASDEPGYDALVIARDVQPDQWIADAPSGQLAIRGRIDGVGRDPATLDANFDLEILPSVFEGVRVDTSLVRFTLADGLANADTFVIHTDVGDVFGRGTFGLVESKSGALILDITAPDLATWNRWLVPGRNVSRPDTIVEDLFAGFPSADQGPAGPAAPAVPAATVDTLAGSLTARGVVFGHLHDYGLGGSVDAKSISYGDFNADSLSLTLDVNDPLKPDSATINSTAWQVEALGERLDSLKIRWQRLGPERSDLTFSALRGTSLEIETHALIDWTESERSAQLDVLRLHLGNQTLWLVDTTRIVSNPSGFRIDGFRLTGTGQSSLRADGQIPRDGPARFDLSFENVQLADERGFWPEPPDLDGRLSGSIEVRGTAAEPRMSGRLTIAAPAVDSVGYERIDASFAYGNRSLEGRIDVFASGDTLAVVDGRLGIDLAFEKREHRLSDDAVDFTVRADSLPLELAALPFGNLDDVRGHARGEVRARGSLEALELDGAAAVIGGAATLPDLGVRFGGVTGQLRFAGQEAFLDSLPVTSSEGGFLVVAGRVDLADLTDVGFDMDLRADRFAAIKRRKMSFLVTGDAHLGGTYSAPDLTGQFRLSDGTLRADQLFRDRSVVDLSDPGVLQFIDTTLVAERRLVSRAQNPFLQHLRMDAQVAVGPNLWLRSDRLEVEMGGQLAVTMDRAQQDIRAVGPVRLQRGRFRYEVGPYSRNFKITSGTIDFIGTPGVNPNLDIYAEYETRTTRGVVLVVTLHVTGTMLEPTLSLSSQPQLAEADLVCYVFFSSPCVSVTGSQGGTELGAQLARDQVLGTVSSSLSSVLVGETGLDYLDIRSAASASPYRNTDASESFLSDTEVEIGKYLSRDVFVSVRQAIGRAVPPAVRVEYKFGESWTAVARTERYLSNQLIRNYSGFTTKQLVGVSLFREWDF
jgi:hypothetical protein